MQAQGFVVCVLSGDSVVVRMSPPSPHLYVVVCFEQLVAPRMGRADGKMQDEKGGYESFSFTREKLLSQRVLVDFRSQITPNQTRSHPSFDTLYSIYSRVYIIDRQMLDFGLFACREGFLKCRKTSKMNQYTQQLADAEKCAKEKQIGSLHRGAIRRLPYKLHSSVILSERTFDCDVEWIINPNTIAVSILPYHSQAIAKIAGFVYNKENEKDAFDFIRCGLQSRKCSISFIQSFENEHNQSTYICAFVDSNSESVIDAMVRRGLFSFDTKHYDFCPHFYKFLGSQYEAQTEKIGIWKDFEQKTENESRYEEIVGTVTMIKTTSSIIVKTEQNEEKEIIFGSLEVPWFSRLEESEFFGVEARQYIARLLYGKIVHCKVIEVYSDLTFASVMINGKYLKELLCAEGLAKPFSFVFLPVQESLEFPESSFSEAISQRKGIHSQSSPFNGRFIDYSLSYKNAQKEIIHGNHQCIVDSIISGSRFVLFLPKDGIFIRANIDGIAFQHPDDDFFKESLDYSTSMFLYSEGCVNILSTDRTGTCFVELILTKNDKEIDVAISLLENGLCAPFQTNYMDEYYRAALHKAIVDKKGMWADNSISPQVIKEGLSYDGVFSDFKEGKAIIELTEKIECINKLLLDADSLRAKPVDQETNMIVSGNGRKRAIVLNSSLKPGYCSIRYLDYDASETVPISTVYKLPIEAKKYYQQVISVRLVGVDVGVDGASTLKRVFGGKSVTCCVFKNDMCAIVDKKGVCLNKGLIARKLGSFTSFSEVPACFEDVWRSIELVGQQSIVKAK